MNKTELKLRLEELAVNPQFYALDGTLKPDADIILEKDFLWEVTYMDERGSFHDRGIFATESEACERVCQIFKHIEDQRAIFG